MLDTTEWQAKFGGKTKFIKCLNICNRSFSVPAESRILHIHWHGLLINYRNLCKLFLHWIYNLKKKQISVNSSAHLKGHFQESFDPSFFLKILTNLDCLLICYSICKCAILSAESFRLLSQTLHRHWHHWGKNIFISFYYILYLVFFLRQTNFLVP